MAMPLISALRPWILPGSIASAWRRKVGANCIWAIGGRRCGLGGGSSISWCPTLPTFPPKWSMRLSLWFETMSLARRSAVVQMVLMLVGRSWSLLLRRWLQGVAAH